MTAWLVNWALCATALLALGMLASAALGRRSAPLRHGLLVVTLVLALLSPALPWFAARAGLGFPVLPSAVEPARAVVQQDEDTAAPPGQSEIAIPTPRPGAEPGAGGTGPANANAFGARGASRSPAPVATSARWLEDTSTSGTVLAILVLGSLIGLVRLARGLTAVARLRTRMQLTSDTEILTDVHDACREAGLDHRPTVGWAPGVPAPMSTGVRRPAILLPPELRGHLDTQARRAVLTHEVGHIAGHHHAIGLIQHLASALLWWHPLAHLANARVRALHEELADNWVLRSGVPARRYARSLVDLAERTLPQPALPAATSLFGTRSPLEQRVESLLRNGRSTMTRLDLTGTVLVTALGGLAALAAASSTLLSAQGTQDTQGHDGTRYFPLGSGASWEYSVRQQGNDIVHVNRVEKQVRAGKEMVWECATRRHQMRGWEYWGIREDGIYKFRNRSLGPRRGVSSHEPTRVLACPVGAVPIWEWEELMSYQSMQGSAPIPRDELLIKHKAEIEAMRDTVVVPAGEFEAVRVKTTSVHKNWTRTVTRWWAPGVGLVKAVGTAGGHERGFTKELRRYIKAPPPGPPAEDVLADHLKRTARGEAKVRWIDHDVLRDWFRSRFALVDGVFLRVQGKRVTPFDPRQSGAWNQLLTDEGIVIKHSGRAADGQAAGAVTGACAVLITEEALPPAGMGASPVHLFGQVVETDFRNKTYKIKVRARLKRSKVAAYNVHTTVTKGAVEQILILPTPGEAPVGSFKIQRRRR